MDSQPDFEPPISATTVTTAASGRYFLSPSSPSLSDYDHADHTTDSNCSSPYVSAPSSPGHSSSVATAGFFYSAPTSPMHYVLASAPARSTLAPTISDASSTGSFEFDFSDRINSPAREPTMSSADELFCNGQIRPMKLSDDLHRPQQSVAPFFDFDGELERRYGGYEEGETFRRSRDLRFGGRSQRRRARSLSPLRNSAPFDWLSCDDAVSSSKNAAETEEREAGDSGAQKEESENSTARPAGSRSSRRWDFLKDFLRSKSEGRSNKFWHNISFSPAKERKEREIRERVGNVTSSLAPEKVKVKKGGKEAPVKKSPAPAPAKRRSVHEMHYAAKRAQAEERRKRTFLPYRQGVLGCLGFNSKSYGALSGFATSFNSVSSR